MKNVVAYSTKTKIKSLNVIFFSFYVDDIQLSAKKSKNIHICSLFQITKVITNSFKCLNWLIDYNQVVVSHFLVD